MGPAMSVGTQLHPNECRSPTVLYSGSVDITIFLARFDNNFTGHTVTGHEKIIPETV